MIQLRRAVAPLVAFTAAGLLVGCSNETAATPVVSSATAGTAAPVASPTASSVAATPTAVATKNLPPPEQDELSRTFTVDGASAFAAYFTRVLNHANATGDPSLLLSLSDASCSGCQYLADVIDEYRTLGYASPGFVIQFTGTRVDSWDAHAGEIGLTVTTTKTSFDTIDSQGNVIGSAEAVSNGEFWIDLNWVEDRWIVWETE